MSSYAETILPQLRLLPPPLAALLLQQAMRHEVMFPREQRELEATLARLRAPRSADAEAAVKDFRALHMPAGQERISWETDPGAYAEAFTAGMWSTGQIAAFRAAARKLLPPESSDEGKVSRAAVVMLDAQLQTTGTAPELFRRLRPAGTLFTRVRGPEAGGGERKQLEEWMHRRAVAADTPYAHWLISGAMSTSWRAPAAVVRIGYDDLRPARLQLLRMMNKARFEQNSGGPESLRSAMLKMQPADMGMARTESPVLQAFAADVLVGGSGTQLYSTTFVQWTLREALRRARPQTVVAHFVPRNGSASMDVRLSNPEREPAPDPAGSLLDAEMHTYMTYINLLRLPSRDVSFLAWHPGYKQVLMIAPGVAAGVTDTTERSLQDLLQRMG